MIVNMLFEINEELPFLLVIHAVVGYHVSILMGANHIEHIAFMHELLSFLHPLQVRSLFTAECKDCELALGYGILELFLDLLSRLLLKDLESNEVSNLVVQEYAEEQEYD